MSGLQGPISRLRGHPGLKRARSRPEKGPSKVRWPKNGQFSFLGGAHSTRGHFHGYQSSGCATVLLGPFMFSVALKYAIKRTERDILKIKMAYLSKILTMHAQVQFPNWFPMIQCHLRTFSSFIRLNVFFSDIWVGGVPQRAVIPIFPYIRRNGHLR